MTLAPSPTVKEVLKKAPCVPPLVLQGMTILRDELIQIYFRRRALLSLIIYFILIAIVMRVFIAIQSRIALTMGPDQLYEAVREALDQQVTGVDLSRYLNIADQVKGLPLSLVLMQLFSFLWLPTLISLLSCDIISLDVSRGTIRFLLLRATRSSYLFGRVAAHTLAGLIIHALTMIFLYLLSVYFAPGHKLAEFWSVCLLYLWVALPFLFLSVAISALVSSFTRRTLVSLLLIQVVWLALMLALRVHPLLSPFQEVLVVGFFNPQGGEYWYAVGGFWVWGILFYLATWFRMRWREV